MSENTRDSLPRSGETPEIDPIPVEPAPPRLGILHFLVWTACVAVCLGWVQSVQSFKPNSESPLARISAVMLAIGSLPAGAAIGGLLLWPSRRRRGIPFPVHPGEYLLVVLGTCILLNLLFSATLRLALAQVIQNDGTRWLLVVSGCFNVFFGAIYLVAAFCQRTWRWRLYFAVASACLAFSDFYIRPELPYLLGNNAVPLFFLLAAIVKDRVSGNRYPWTHWLGIVAQIVSNVLDLAGSIWLVWFLSRSP